MKNKFGLLDKDLETIISVLSQQPKVEKAYLFGSRAKGNFKNGSDIDLALKGNNLDFNTISQISYQLNEETTMPYKFDVLNYHTIKEPDLKDHIDRVGIELYSRWKEYRILELGKVITGNTPSSKFPEEFGNEMPFVTPTDYKNYNKWIYRADRFLSAQGISKLKSRVLPNNSILVTCIGSDMGKIAINKIPVITNQQINSIITNEKVNPDFLYYKLVSCYDVLRTYGEAGTAVPIVNKGDFENIEIIIPTDLKEQTAIASILSSLDNKIDLLHRQNKTLEQLAETLFRQWFVEEEDWLGTLSEFVKVQGGYAFKSKDFRESGFAGIIKITNISMGFVDINKCDYVDEKAVLNLDEKFKIRTGDFLIAMTGAEIGKIGIVENTNKEIWLNQRVGKLEAKVPYGNLIGYLALKSREGQDHIINACSGSAQENISTTGIEEMVFAKYDEEKAISFGKEASHLFEKITTNYKQIKTLSKTRDNLLPKLMSGEVRVKM